MAYQWVLLLTVRESLSIVLDATRETVESGRADFPVLADHNAPDLGRGILAPSRDVGCQIKESPIPLLAHDYTSLDIIVRLILGQTWVVSFP